MNLNLNKREKIVVSAAIVFLSVFILVQLIIIPVIEKRDALSNRLDAKKSTLAEMKTLRLEYLSIQKKAESSKQGFKNRTAGFTLFSFLDSLAGDTGVKDHIAYMKPSTTVAEGSGLKISRVEMKLSEITLEDLTSYLFKVETSENMVMVKRLSITKTEKSSGLITAVLQVETMES
jgi:general secretion pathway protein M